MRSCVINAIRMRNVNSFCYNHVIYLARLPAGLDIGDIWNARFVLISAMVRGAAGSVVRTATHKSAIINILILPLTSLFN